MIINLNQFGNGGGSGPVDVPIATTGRTGVVKIGQGINVDSAGTISVTGGTIEEMPISPFMTKNLNGNGRCFSKEVEFTFFVSRDWSNNGQPFNNYTFNPYLSIKQLNGRNWNQSSYLDIYITKGEQDEYPTFKLVNGYNIGQGFVSEKLIEEPIDFQIGVEGEYNQVEFDIRDFLLRADNRYGSQDYTVKGLKVEIINDGTGNGYLKLKMDSDDNQTFLNYLILLNDAYDYNVNIDQTFAATQGHYPIATNSNVGMVQIGSGFTYSNNNGSLSISTASKNQTGIVRIGDGLDVDENGVLSDKDDVKVVSGLPTTSVTETIGSIWYVGQEQTGDFTCMAGNDIEFRKGNTNPQENITLFKIESYSNYTTLELTPDGTYIVIDESGTEHYLNDGDFLEISGTNVTYTFSFSDINTITISEDKEIVDVYVDTPVTKVLAVGDEGDIVAMVDASENLCFYEIVNQEWSEKYAHSSGGSGGDSNVLKPVLELPLSADTNDVYNYLEKQPIFSATTGNTEILTNEYSFSLSSGTPLTLHYEGRPAALLRFRFGSSTNNTRYISYKNGNYYKCGGSLGVTETLISDGDTEDNGNLTYNITQNGDFVLTCIYKISSMYLLAELNKEDKYVEKLVKYTSESELTANIDEYQNVYGYYVIEYDEVPEEIVEICSMSGNNKSLKFYLNRDVILVTNYGSEYDYIKHNEQYQETANHNHDLHWEVTWFGNRITFGITNDGLNYNQYYSFNNATSYDWKKNGWIRANVEHNNIEGYYTIDPIYIRDSKGNIVSQRNKTISELRLSLNGSVTASAYGIYPYGQNGIFNIFTPTTTGQTGYVCTSQGNAAPTWKDPSTLLNKSTLYGTHSTFIVATDDWKLLDSSSNNTFGAGNFYIYNTCDYNVTMELVDFNDSTDDGQGGITDPTKELKVSANTDGSYDVFYGEFIDYQGGLYSYTASTHLDTVFSDYTILTEDQTGNIVRIILRPDGLYCHENNSGCGFVNNSYSTFGVGDSVTIGKITVFVNFEDTPSVYFSQDEGV